MALFVILSLDIHTLADTDMKSRFMDSNVKTKQAYTYTKYLFLFTERI